MDHEPDNADGAGERLRGFAAGDSPAETREALREHEPADRELKAEMEFGDNESQIAGGRGWLAVTVYRDGETDLFICDNGVQGQGFTLSAAETRELGRLLARFDPPRPHPPVDLLPLDCFDVTKK